MSMGLGGDAASLPSVMGLARQEVRALALYGDAPRQCRVDASDNTNLWGSPPAALAAIRAATAGEVPSVSRYPGTYSAPLAERVLAHLGLSAHDGLGVVVGCGSDDIIDSAMRAFATEGATIAYSVPTFSMIPVFARLNGLRSVEVPLCGDFDIDAERLVAAGAAITYICAPNNPTGTSVSRAAIERVLAGAGGLVIVDEAYAEFAAATAVDLVHEYTGLLVTRTFSKAFGLAGLRVGYGVGNRSLADLVARARGPYKVSVPAERGAMAALEDGGDALEWVRAYVREALVMRSYLSNGLSAMGLQPLPSDANFVFVPHPNAAALAWHLLDQGVRVRAIARLTGPSAIEDAGGSGLRIGVGPRDTMDVVLAALQSALSELPGAAVEGGTT